MTMKDWVGNAYNAADVLVCNTVHLMAVGAESVNVRDFC